MGLFDERPVQETPVDEKEKLKQEISQAMEKYKQQISKQLVPQHEAKTKGNPGETAPIETREYTEFKKEYIPVEMSLYEKACAFSEKIVKINPPPGEIDKLKKNIEICHLNVTPTGVYSFSFLGPIPFAFLGALISFLLLDSTFFAFFFLMLGLILIKPLQGVPGFLANSWRMKASNQMVICIFYIVTYMRHTSNLELAIKFATEHLEPPLSLDLRRVLWNVETGRYSSIKESLDEYLDTWKEWNMEFIESFHLIESSLYEGDESRRIGTLDKALSVMLEETYEKMLHYAQNLKSPITMLHMMGVILPILGLVILPLVVSFMTKVKWYHLAALYNILLPVAVYYLAKKILSTRPTGYGDTDISENPEIKKYQKILIHLGKSEIKLEPMAVCVIIGLIFVFIGLSPLIIHMLVYDSAQKTSHWDLIYTSDNQLMSTYEMSSPKAKFAFLDYKFSIPREGTAAELIGPYGIGASILSLLLVLGIGTATGLYFKLRSKNIMKIREKSKQLEQEFASALFQLGNRLGDGLPVEIAFGKVAQTMEGTVSGKFFEMVSSNMTRLGMGVEQAIFDPQRGALVYYPSKIIESSMKVLTESTKKGPSIAASALINVSNYIKEIHKVNERLKDLLAEIISSMRSQISFMAPVIAGIVIGITSMITTILGKLGIQMRMIQGSAGSAGVGGGGLLSLFGDSVPTYFFQFMVGLYVVQIVYILTIITNGIENGEDKLNERYLLGKNIMGSTMTYIAVAGIVMLIFNILAMTILRGISGV